ncbi:MAG: phospholipase D-like domain-containing protein [Nanoarchaeota archaeon]
MVVNKCLFLIWVILFSGCSLNPPDNAISIIPREENSFIDAHFCRTENCSKYLIKYINGSNSIHCAFFDLDLDDVIRMLNKKSKSSDVKVVIDNENKIEHVSGSGIRYDTKSQYSHNKFCIFDAEVVFTGSFNPTDRGNNKNDNNIVIIRSAYLAKNYEDEFKELWNKTFGKGKKVTYPVIYLNHTRVENYFCPEDDCADQIIKVIGKAKESIYFMTFSFTHEEIADAILFRDIKIKGVFEKTQAGSDYSQYQRFKDFGLDVIKDNNPANMHHKVFIIDEKIVITGSFNPSKNADTENDENILIIYDEQIASQYLDEFERVWNV